MLKGKRTYITCGVLAFHQVLNMMGFTEFTGEELSHAIDIILAVVAFIFRRLANKPEVRRTT